MGHNDNIVVHVKATTEQIYMGCLFRLELKAQHFLRYIAVKLKTHMYVLITASENR